MGGDGGGGGGGDGGYAAQQAAQESRKQAARDAINRIFGVGATTSAAEPVYGAATGGDYIGINEQGDSQFSPTTTPVIGTRMVTDTAAADAKAGREAAYGRVKSGVYDLNKQKLDTDRTDAARQLRFALLRSGNSGGSLDIDQNNLLQRKMDQGVIDATNMADAAALNARTSDEKARLDLLSRIDAGMDQGSAVQGAQSQLQSSADTALAQAKGQIIGNVFDNAGLLYQASQGNQGYANGMNQYFRGRGVSGAFAPGTAGTINRT